MHEMSVVLHMVNLAEQYARENNASKIVKLVVEIGEFHSAVPEYVEYFFPDVTENTLLEGAALEIIRIPGQARCRNCGRIYHWRREKYKCPECDSEECEIITGREFDIREIGIV